MDPPLNNEIDDLSLHLAPLLERAGIESVQLDVLTKRPSFRGGEVSTQAQNITGPAREEHLRRHFGFWEYVLSAATAADPDTRAALIAGALRHHTDPTRLVSLSLAEFTANLRSNRYSNLPSRMVVSLTSQIGMSRESRSGWHLPMLDLGAPVSHGGEQACVDALKALGASGLLFSSGKSYHFYANKVVSESEFLKFLARAQLLSPIVDARWISHQLLDCQAALRISTDAERYRRPHRFVAVLE